MIDNPYATPISLITDSPSWYGCPPAHWAATKIKYLLSERRKETSGTFPPGAISFGEVVAKEMINEETLASYQDVHSGDFVINPINLNYDLKSLRVALSQINVRVSPAYIVLKNASHADSRYLRWLLYLFDVAHMKTLGAGVRQTITFSEIGSCAVWLPPPQEQTRIANFLDEQTVRIDALIAEKERLDGLLGEYRASLISAAVTGQVDVEHRRVYKRGRGVSGWPVTRLRYVAELNPVVRQELLQAPETEVSFLPMEAIGEDGCLNLERTRPVTDVRNGYSYFEDGDVAFAKVTPCFENGKGALMSGLEGAAGFGTTELTVLRPKQGTVPRFLHYVVQSSLFRRCGAAAMTGAGGLKRVPDEFTRDFTTPWPSFVEQTRIANFLDEQTARIDVLREHCRKHITLLREYRASLISAAVTGQLDIDNCRAIGALASGG